MHKKLEKRWEKLRPDKKKTIINTEWQHGIKRLFEDNGRVWEVRLPAEAPGHTVSGYAVFRRKSGKKADPTGTDTAVSTSASSLKLTQ
jgi:hypothetical protein